MNGYTLTLFHSFFWIESRSGSFGSRICLVFVRWHAFRFQAAYALTLNNPGCSGCGRHLTHGFKSNASQGCMVTCLGF